MDTLFMLLSAVSETTPPNDPKCYWLCFPTGPSDPFGSPVLVLFDSLRILAALFGLAVTVAAPTLIVRATTAGQRARFAALAMFALSTTATELLHLGDYANSRLALNLAAVVLAAYGIWSFYVCERPPVVTPEHEGDEACDPSGGPGPMRA